MTDHISGPARSRLSVLDSDKRRRVEEVAGRESKHIVWETEISSAAGKPTGPTWESSVARAKHAGMI